MTHACCAPFALRLARAARAPFVALLLAAAAPGAVASAEFLDRDWYVLIHYQDSATARPEAWHWDEQVWSFERRGSDLLWTAYELVSFVDVRGRFADLRSPWARRLPGAWEPDASQRREIARGLFVNPRGARTLLLVQRGDAWTSEPAGGQGAVRLGLSLQRSATIVLSERLPEVTVSQSAVSAGTLQETVETRYRALAPRPDGGFEGEYRADPRSGRFRMMPTRIREPVRAGVERGEGRLLLQPDAYGQWEHVLPAVLRPWHYTRARVVSVDTVPAGAQLDVSYLRDGARRLFEQTRAPVTLVLPPRFRARESDTVQIDAFAPGYQADQRLVRVLGHDEEVRIELAPAANVLREVWLRSLGGTTTLSLITEHPLELRTGRTPGRLTLLLPATSPSAAAADLLGALSGGPIRSAELLQLDDTALLRLELVDGASSEHDLLLVDPGASGEARTLVRLPPPTEASLEQWKAALRRAANEAPPAELAGCALHWEAALREQLSPAALARSLTVPDPVLRALLSAALDRLAARDPGGEVALLDRSRLRVAVPLERQAALLQPQEVEGLLAAVRALARRLDGDESELLRGALAPGLTPASFAAATEAARDAEARCRRGALPRR